MNYYAVYIRTNGAWTRVSREFERERQAQEWALDLDGHVSRRIERVHGE